MKTLERLVLEQLQPIVKPLLHPLHFAYQPQLGVEDGIIYLLNCVYAHLDKPASTYAIVGCISKGNEDEYRAAVDNFVTWCEQNHLQLNVVKTKELTVDLKRTKALVTPVSIQVVSVDIVEDYKYLGDMDAKTFYGRKQQECEVRAIPTDSEDSELDSDSEEVDQEEWIPESGENQHQGSESDTEEEQGDENEEVAEVSHLPRWRKLHSTNTDVYPEWQGQLPTADDIMSPLQYFREFFSEEILHVIVDESNIYAIQCDPNKPLNLTTSELEQFLGTVVYMSLFGLPATRMFWNKAPRVSQVADTMTLNRWEAIKKSLHFNNNERQEENDPLYKIRPLITHLTSKLVSIPMSEKLSVDEQMVPFKGRHRLKQYLPSKPKKWGYKILILAGSDFVPYNLEIYTGRVNQPPELADVGASGNIVLRLAQPIPKEENYKIFFDNWFTSVPLVLTLVQQGIRCTGTVRANRLPGVNLKSDADLKRAGRGAFEEKMALVGETTLHVVKWYDNRSVTLLSDHTGANPVTEWYHRLVFHFLDMIITTTWLLYRRDCEGTGIEKKDQMKLYTFKSYVAEGLCKSGKSLEKKRGRQSLSIAAAYEEKRRRGPAAPIPVPDVRLDQTAHWLIMTGDKGRCRVSRCNGTPKAMCRKCNVHFCFTPERNCFLKFHTE
ncbi:piggyBac transposable element-derived protein 2-like [Chaetodon trifascialis]|uniref:piggyBac transposable element-derived protein 2-like n=1 Tax=Chaetodon trifascialis TaxID=109706 RepID=UPI0039943C86